MVNIVFFIASLGSQDTSSTNRLNFFFSNSGEEFSLNNDGLFRKNTFSQHFVEALQQMVPLIISLKYSIRLLRLSEPLWCIWLEDIEKEVQPDVQNSFIFIYFLQHNQHCPDLLQLFNWSKLKWGTDVQEDKDWFQISTYSADNVDDWDLLLWVVLVLLLSLFTN